MFDLQSMGERLLYLMIVSVIFFLVLPFSGMCFFISNWSQLSLSEMEFFSLEWSGTSYSTMFGFVVMVVSITILLFTSYYMSGEFSIGYYIILMAIFMMSMLMLLISNSWTLLILSWEGLGVSSFFLINYYSAWESYNNSLVTLMTMRVGEYFFFILLSSVFFTYSMGILNPFFSEVSLFGLLLMSMTKSASIPFSGWLPKAMSAPTPTSALVHSSTLVVAGLVLMMAYSELLMSPSSMVVMVFIGLFTMMVGSLLTLMESSVKKLVAYSTLSQIGLSMLVYGLGQFQGGFILLISHGFAKSLLFIQVGALIHSSMNNQNYRVWGGSTLSALHRVQLSVTLMSLCGISFFGGMLAKESALDLLGLSSYSFLLLVVISLSVYLTFIYSVLLYSYFFNSMDISVSLQSESLMMVFFTMMEFVMVISHLTWMSMNYLTFPVMLNYSKVMLPFFVLPVVWFSFTLVSKMGLMGMNLNRFLLMVGNIQHYQWFSWLLLPLVYLESSLYSLNLKYSVSLTSLWIVGNKYVTFRSRLMMLLVLGLMLLF